MVYNADRDFHKCGRCMTEVWPGDIAKERNEYNKNRHIILNSLAAQTTALNSKPVNPPGRPVFKGGSKTGKKRKKKPNIKTSDMNTW